MQRFHREPNNAVQVSGKTHESGVPGTLGYFGLSNWRLSVFTVAERDHIEAVFNPMGTGRTRPLTSGKITSTSATVSQTLYTLAGWFRKPEDRHIAKRLLAKAEAVVGKDFLDRHFLYQQIIETYSHEKSDAIAQREVIRAADAQIALSPKAAKAWRSEYGDRIPAHVGFQTMIGIRTKDGDCAGVASLSKQAQGQGWSGSWEKMADRYGEKPAPRSRKLRQKTDSPHAL